MSGLRKTSIALMRRSTSSTTASILPHSGGGGAVSPPSSGVGVATEIEKSIAMQRLRTGESANLKKLNVRFVIFPHSLHSKKKSELKKKLYHILNVSPLSIKNLNLEYVLSMFNININKFNFLIK